jgi:uncharacterized protein YndB with AHSA1/START domain
MQNPIHAAFQTTAEGSDRHEAAFPPEASRDGRKLSVNGVPALRFERRLKHDVATVWAALVEPAALARWLQAGATVDPWLGGRFHLVFHGATHAMPGVITAWQPPRLLEYTWPEAEAHGDSTVRFELAPQDTGCILVLTHLFPAGATLADFASGWHWHLDALEPALLGHSVTFDRPRWAALQTAYAARLEPQVAATCT